MKLQLKFRDGTKQAGRQRVIEKATRAGARAVRPLFPGDKDEALASLYVVDVANPARHDALVSLLSAEKSVEFVEDEVRRRAKA
jgi:hypothetical protein